VVEERLPESINNGITHGDRGCTIVVTLEREGATYRLHVYNTGKTVPEAYRPMLFYDNQGVLRSKESRPVLALKLPLSRDLIQNQGGDIRYEAKVDGPTFVVTLPQH
jgi:K+-sensing histidine kinase KdpD